MAEPELFSIERFQDWTSRLILDNGENWKLAFQIEFMEDLFNETWRGKLTGYLLVRGGVHQIAYAHGPRARLASAQQCKPTKNQDDGPDHRGTSSAGGSSRRIIFSTSKLSPGSGVF